MVFACVLVPLVAGVFILVIPDARGVWRAWTPPAVGLVHAVLAASLWNGGALPSEAMFGPDALGLVFLSLASAVFLPTMLHAAMLTLRPEPSGGEDDVRAEQCAGSAAKAAAALFFLAATSCLCCVQSMTAMVVCLELAALATLFPTAKRDAGQAGGRRCFAVWGIACFVALAGLALAALSGAFADNLFLDARAPVATAPALDKAAVKAAFACILLGCGAKMGLAPMHGWPARLQDGAAPSVSALQSGVLSACAFLPVLRMLSAMHASGEGGYAGLALRLTGIATLAFAALFSRARGSYAGMLGNSTAGHMGLAAFGAGLGGVGVWLALWHAAAHSFVKASMFLVSGAIAGRYRSHRVADVSGLRQAMPGNGLLWLVGAAALGCLPPFALFYSQFGLLAEAVFAGRWPEACLAALFMLFVFAGTLRAVLSMLRGGAPGVKRRERLATLACPCLLMAAVLILGMGAPAALAKTLDEAARLVEPAFSGVPGVRAR